MRFESGAGIRVRHDGRSTRQSDASHRSGRRAATAWHPSGSDAVGPAHNVSARRGFDYQLAPSEEPGHRRGRCVRRIGGVGVDTNKAPATGSAPTAAIPADSSANITGTFVAWDPVDDSSGYALFTLHNSGTASGVAKCTISVKDDFGDFGFDSLVGETVELGQRVSGKIPINVGKGSFKMNHGEVKDC